MTSFRALLLRNVLLATVLPLVGLVAFLMRDQALHGRDRLDDSLRVTVSLVSTLLEDQPDGVLQEKLEKLDRDLGVRLTIVRPNGEVLGDTESQPGRMENHLRRPEVQRALQLGIGTAERSSPTLGIPMRYLAISRQHGDEQRIYRAAVPVSSIQEQIRRTQLTVLFGVLVVVVILLYLTSRLDRQIVTPIDALSAAAARFSAGDPNAHVLPDGPEVVRRLGKTFNEMVERLNTHVRRLDNTQGHLDAVIRQMPEGLLVLDSRGTITRANEAAEAFLGLASDRIVGRRVLAVVLNYSLDREVSSVLEGGRGGSVEVRAGNNRVLRVAVGPLAVKGEPAGAVVILQDVTELRRTDDMRRDFVANVSHELRTPVAAIRALAETLQLRSAKRPELAAEYLPRIVTECGRVECLVADLLLLAQTEAGQLRLQLEALDPKEVAQDIVRLVEPVAQETHTRLVLEEFASGGVIADRFALEQCIRNLADNAVRYASGGTVRISSRIEGSQVVICVADNGPGIPEEDLPRIFERFYRVDKARSREVGGSGLGLSIVRHLTEAQGGRAWVESTLGQGSTFYLAFPRCP